MYKQEKGKRDANGNIVLTIADDFTNCGTRVESVLDEDGTVTDYVVSIFNFIDHSNLEPLYFWNVLTRSAPYSYSFRQCGIPPTWNLLGYLRYLRYLNFQVQVCSRTFLTVSKIPKNLTPRTVQSHSHAAKLVFRTPDQGWISLTTRLLTLTTSRDLKWPLWQVTWSWFVWVLE